MAYVYLLELNDETYVVSSFRNAADRVLHHVDPTFNKMIGDLHEFKGLETRELAGSYLHRVRYAIEKSKNINAEVIVHDPDIGILNAPTASWFYDFKHTIDPAYEVQAALYRVSEGLTDIATAAQVVYQRVESDIDNLRGSGHSDLTLMVAYADLEDLMGSTFFMVPRIGDAKEFIESFPEVAKIKFLEMAEKAFPDKFDDQTSLKM